MPQLLNAAGRAYKKRRLDLAKAVGRCRRATPWRSAMGSAYRKRVGDGHSATGAPEDWASYLRRMTSRPGWSVARLARESGIHRGTIFDWMAGKGGVTISSVRAIAEALDDDPANALLAAGNVSRPGHEHLDPDVRVILRRLADPTVSEAEKVAIRATLRYLRELAERPSVEGSGEGRETAS